MANKITILIINGTHANRLFELPIKEVHPILGTLVDLSNDTEINLATPPGWPFELDIHDGDAAARPTHWEKYRWNGTVNDDGDYVFEQVVEGDTLT